MPVRKSFIVKGTLQGLHSRQIERLEDVACMREQSVQDNTFVLTEFNSEFNGGVSRVRPDKQEQAFLDAFASSVE